MADVSKINGYNIKDTSARSQLAQKQDTITDLTQIRANATAGASAQTAVTSISALIPSQASTSNQLADKNFVNSSIENVAAYYITKNAAGDPFATKAELNAATTFYSGGVVRIPTRNDYCVVTSDESKATQYETPTTRYLYNDGWEFQYVVNNSGLTAAQWESVNSGITASGVTQISTTAQGLSQHISNNNNPHSVTAAQIGIVISTSAPPAGGGGYAVGTVWIQYTT